MKKYMRYIFLAVLIAALAGGGYWGYTYWYDATYYFTTDNASVSANTVTITPLVSGAIATWEIKEGDKVREGQLLGRQDLDTLVQSSDINTKSLSSSADQIISRAELKSPIDGTVVASYGLIGETITPGMTVAVVADTDNMYITANIEETDIFRVKEGQPVTVAIDAWPGKAFTGYVKSVGQATQSAFSTMPSLNTSGTYTKVTQLIPVKISIVLDEETPLLIGMNATVKIRVKE